MARPLRIEYPGAWYHVLHRGAGRRRIFLDDADRGRFFALLGDMSEIFHVEVHAYSLIENHYHLLIHTPEARLSRAMRHLDGVYTQRFNRAHGTDGALFRGRFKAILIQKESYLLELVRYIHLNPVRAGLCSDVLSHRWTSHTAYIHRKNRPPWLVTGVVLSHFGDRPALAVRELDRFVRAGASPLLTKQLEGDKLPSVLGDESFRDWIKYNFVKRLRRQREIPDARRTLRRSASLDSIMRFIVELYGVSRRDLKAARHVPQNEARAMACYLMRKVGNASHRNIANFFGASLCAVAQSIHRFNRRLEVDGLLAAKTQSAAEALLSNVKT